MIFTFYIVLLTGYFLLSDAGGRTPGKIRRDLQTSRYTNHTTETQNNWEHNFLTIEFKDNKVGKMLDNVY